MLFKPMAVPNRAETQLAYKLKYFPSVFLSAAAKKLVYSTQSVVMSKAAILYRTDPPHDFIQFDNKAYKIVWAFNNIPTEEEWDKFSDSKGIHIEFRKTPAVPEKYVAIFSFTQTQM